VIEICPDEDAEIPVAPVIDPELLMVAGPPVVWIAVPVLDPLITPPELLVTEICPDDDAEIAVVADVTFPPTVMLTAPPLELATIPGGAAGPELLIVPFAVIEMGPTALALMPPQEIVLPFTPSSVLVQLPVRAVVMELPESVVTLSWPVP